jgi:hypothetical protein
VKSAADAVALWAISKASERARLDLHVDYTIESARRGRFETARDVALETVGHVSVEDPRPHLLLGQLAIALGDRRLLAEARTFLQALKFDDWLQHLDGLAQAGVSGFGEAPGA